MEGMIGQMQGGEQMEAGPKGNAVGKQDVQQFITDTMRSLYSEEQQQQMLQMLAKNKDNIGQAMGQLAGALVMSVVTRRSKQNGKKPHIKMIIKGLQLVIRNIAEMVTVSKIAKLTEEDLQTAANVAGQIVEAGGKQAGPQQGPPQGQPPQGMPQQGGMPPAGVPNAGGMQGGM